MKAPGDGLLAKAGLLTAPSTLSTVLVYTNVTYSMRLS